MSNTAQQWAERAKRSAEQLGDRTCVHNLAFKGHVRDECCGVIERALIARGAPRQFGQCYLTAGHTGDHKTPNGAKMFALHRYHTSEES
jgi:hypothetical protein